jgi:hypothetical protein
LSEAKVFSIYAYKNLCRVQTTLHKAQNSIEKRGNVKTIFCLSDGTTSLLRCSMDRIRYELLHLGRSNLAGQFFVSFRYFFFFKQIGSFRFDIEQNAIIDAFVCFRYITVLKRISQKGSEAKKNAHVLVIQDSFLAADKNESDRQKRTFSFLFIFCP